jgi:hypothetical protein
MSISDLHLLQLKMIPKVMTLASRISWISIRLNATAKVVQQLTPSTLLHPHPLPLGVAIGSITLLVKLHRLHLLPLPPAYSKKLGIRLKSVVTGSTPPALARANGLPVKKRRRITGSASVNVARLGMSVTGTRLADKQPQPALTGIIAANLWWLPPRVRQWNHRLLPDL